MIRTPSLSSRPAPRFARHLAPALAPALVIAALAGLLAAPAAHGQDPPTSTTDLADVQLDAGTLRVHFIDIGGGLAALIETPGGKHVLIDGGKKGGTDYDDYVEAFVDEDRIDILIVTHADDDHFFNLVGFIEEYEVGEFWNTGYTSKKLMKLKRWPRFLAETKPALVDAGMVDWTPIGDFVAPGEWESIDDLDTESEDDDVWVQYLNVDKQPPLQDPDSGRTFRESERRNNASLVFKVVWHDTSFLFTGDINGRRKFTDPEDAVDSEEKELLDRHASHDTFSLKATVLQVAHHGSDGSTSMPFLRAVEPEWAVIPAGNAHEHPHEPTLERLRAVIEPDARILRTDEGVEHADPTGDDNLIFVVGPAGITEVLRVRVEG